MMLFFESVIADEVGGGERERERKKERKRERERERGSLGGHKEANSHAIDNL